VEASKWGLLNDLEFDYYTTVLYKHCIKTSSEILKKEKKTSRRILERFMVSIPRAIVVSLVDCRHAEIRPSP